MNDAWIADRMSQIEASGIRKAFDMSKSMKDPINLSIGLPDFDVADPVKAAAIEAIERGHNAYTLTQGIPELREQAPGRRRRRVPPRRPPGPDHLGHLGGLLLALCSVVNPGDEVIIFDPYFVMYSNLVALAGGTPVLVDTYPDFRIDADEGRRRDHAPDQVRPRQLAGQPDRRRRLGRGDEGPGRALPAPRRPADQRRGLSRLLLRPPVRHPGDLERGRAGRRRLQQVARHDRLAARLRARPGRLIQEMAKLQQFSFVCAPSMVQYAGVVALDQDLTAQIDAYRRKRDAVVAALADDFDLAAPEGAFYAFPRAPGGPRPSSSPRRSAATC